MPYTFHLYLIKIFVCLCIEVKKILLSQNLNQSLTNDTALFHNWFKFFIRPVDCFHTIVLPASALLKPSFALHLSHAKPTRHIFFVDVDYVYMGLCVLILCYE